MKKAFIFWNLLFISMALTIPAFGSDFDLKACQEHLSEPVIKAPKRPVSQAQPRTVRITGKRQVGEGKKGNVFTLKAKSETEWSSNANLKGFDYQGNPTEVYRVLGETLANFFYIRKIDSTTMEIPDEIALNDRIEELNKRLVHLGYEPIKMRFFRQSGMKVFDFNTRFIDKREIAYNETIHDFTYHMFSIVLTEPFLRAVDLRYNVFREFVDLSKTSPETKHLFDQHPELDVFIRIVEKFFASEIDLITGGLYRRLGDGISADIWDHYKAMLDMGMPTPAVLPSASLLTSVVPGLYIKILYSFQQQNFNEFYSKLYNLSTPSDRLILDRIQIEGKDKYSEIINTLTKQYEEHLKQHPEKYPEYVVQRSYFGNAIGGAASTEDIGPAMETRLEQLQTAAAFAMPN